MILLAVAAVSPIVRTFLLVIPAVETESAEGLRQRTIVQVTVAQPALHLS